MTKCASVTVLAISLAAAGCGGSPTPSPAGAPAPAKPATATAVPAKPATAAPVPQPAAQPETAIVSAAPGAARPVGVVQTTTPALGQAAPLVPPTPAIPETPAPGYDPKGRRDPFAEIQTTSGATSLTVATTKLTGIVRSQRSMLALVETTDGIGYILRPGDTLGDGRLVEIGADNVVFAVSAKPGSTSNRVVLRLAAN